jgi:hypothetical protein
MSRILLPGGLAVLAMVPSITAGCRDFEQSSEPPVAVCPELNPQPESLATRPDSTAVLVVSRDTLAAVQPSGQLAWVRRFPADDPMVVYPRIAANSMIYLLTRKNIHAIDSKGATLYQLPHPFEPGELRKPEKMMVEPMPDSTIVVSDGDRSLVSLDSAGSVRWRFTLPPRDSITSAPRAAANGSIYLRSRAWLYSLNHGGKQLWRVPLQQMASTAQ